MATARGRFFSLVWEGFAPTLRKFIKQRWRGESKTPEAEVSVMEKR